VGPPKAVEVTTGGKKLKFGVLFKIVNSDFFKAQFYADLKKRPPTPEERAAGLGYPQGYFHMPADAPFGDEHCKQLCAERLITKKKKNGRTTSEYEKTYRNEALDTQVYCDAAAWDYGSHRFQARHWQVLRDRNKQLAQTPTPVAPQLQQQQQQQQQAVMPQRRRPQIRLL
jgi:phage terminase large subunit GpA-like protein